MARCTFLSDVSVSTSHARLGDSPASTGQSLQSILRMIARVEVRAFCLGTLWTCELPDSSLVVEHKTPKAFSANFYSAWLEKSLWRTIPVCHFSFRTGFFQDATSGTCVPRWGPRTLVDRGFQEFPSPPFFRWFQYSLLEDDLDPQQSAAPAAQVVFSGESSWASRLFCCCCPFVCLQTTKLWSEWAAI